MVDINPLLEKSEEQEKKEKVGEFVGVNLVPEELAALPREVGRERLIFIGAVIFSLLVIGIIYAVLAWSEAQAAAQIREIDREINLVRQETAALNVDKKEILQLQKHLQSVQGLLEQHVYWTKFFAFLEQYTIPDVYYINLAATAKDRIALAARGANFEAVAKQLLSFEQAVDFIQEAIVTTASLDKDIKGIEERINFGVNLVLKPEVFVKKFVE